ncbi:MAG: hypothetical protein R6X19_05905 [Kiritimatiellia bacterium]
MKAKRIILIATLVAGNVMAGESLRAALAYDRHAERLAAAEIKALESAKTILTEADIETLIDQNKLKDAMKAQLARQAKIVDSKANGMADAKALKAADEAKGNGKSGP